MIIRIDICFWYVNRKDVPRYNLYDLIYEIYLYQFILSQFSDLLLLCSLRLIPGPPYRLRAKFLVEDLQVVEGDNLETANTFYIRDENKSVELYTHSAAEKASWLDALFQTMQEIMRRKASLKTGNAKTSLVKADDVTRCMVCEVIFSVMKRKHNCRACGIVSCIVQKLHHRSVHPPTHTRTRTKHVYIHRYTFLKKFIYIIIVAGCL